MSSFGSVANSVRHAKFKLKLIVVQKVRCVPTVTKQHRRRDEREWERKSVSWVDLSGGLSNPCKDSLLLLNKPFCRKTHSSPQGDETSEQAKTSSQPLWWCVLCVDGPVLSSAVQTIMTRMEWKSLQSQTSRPETSIIHLISFHLVLSWMTFGC